MFENIPRILTNQFDSRFLEEGEKIYQKGDYRNFDFVRNSYCAQFSDHQIEYWTFVKKKKDKDNFNFSCDCATFTRYMMCPHTAAMLFIIFSRSKESKTIYDSISKKYYNSIWLILAKQSYESYGNSKTIFNCDISLEAKKIHIIFQTEAHIPIFRFELPSVFWDKIIGKYRYLLFENELEEINQLYPFTENISLPNQELLLVEKTDLEERMNLAGFKSWQQKFEESLWFDFSKIWFLTFNEKSLKITYQHEIKGLEITSSDHDFSFIVPQNQVVAILDSLVNDPESKKSLNIKNDEILLNYSLKIMDSFDLKITPVLLLPNDKEPVVLTKDHNVKLAVFGKYIYIESKGFFLFERTITYFNSDIFNFNEIIIPNEKIPSLLSEYKKAITDNKFYYVSSSLLKESFVSHIDSADIVVNQIGDDWCYLDVKYQIFNETISFYDIYHSIKSDKRYLIGDKYWIDLQLPEFDWIYEITPDQIEIDSSRNVKLRMKKINFFKMRASLPFKSKIQSHGKKKSDLENLLNLTPKGEMPELDNHNYVLRDYQNTGYGWLWFLYENKFSGLLCDDMGLGKTYQSLALLDAITIMKDRANFLVVCPTSVIPHWHDKLSQFKKKVHLHVYHGSERELKYLSRQKYAIVLTSYGVMRNDLQVLERLPFDVMIFDEIQSAKNKASLTNAALNQLNGRIKIGLTGTPIENNLEELKALFDIILPDYLGSDSSFKKKYIDLIEQKNDKDKLEQLHSLINPFILRRTKSQVLEELPPKIEEIRRCELSPDQVKFYRDVINTRAKSIINKLNNANEKIPYMHIFAVLNYLKQICNHPSQLKKNNLDYKKYQSGKWDLFCELLEESLNSGFKVVIFSQYLNMLGLIEAYLKDIGIEFATIKGATRNRGEMIEKFNYDPNCMVFTGSLKAAGWGINLTSGSVVIHYDRWWNAAREDQATDRVHRIGQTRGVQVFKLITQGTLEEKINRLINKKKQLMDSLIKEDDATIVKNFEREELIELLTFK